MSARIRRTLGALLVCALSASAGGCRSPAASKPAAEHRPEARPAAGAVSAPGPVAAAPFSPGDAEHGKKLVAQFQCNRCHEGTGLPAPLLDQDCVRCHEQIATGKFKAPAEKLAKWRPHILAYRDVPSLSAMGRRLRPAWVADYLLNPRVLRPALAQTMPRLALSSAEARDIATYLSSFESAAAQAPEPRAEPGQLARGKQLFAERACTSCHRFTGAGLPPPPKAEPPNRALVLAPDLKFARERAEPAAIAAWLLDPARAKPDAAMPNLGLSPDDARDLAAFLAFAELTPAPASPTPPRLPVLARRVGFDEVNQSVFAVTCRHCHTNPDLAAGDGGPGHSGGFGFPARKLDLSSYAGIQAGAVDAQGNRVSIFAPTREGLPRLVAALVARTHESTGRVSDEVRGMPLGLPPLSAEQIQLVESWVEQGRPL